MPRLELLIRTSIQLMLFHRALDLGSPLPRNKEEKTNRFAAHPSSSVRSFILPIAIYVDQPQGDTPQGEFFGTSTKTSLTRPAPMVRYGKKGLT